MNKFIGNDWDNLLKEEFQKNYFITMEEYIRQEYKRMEIFPAEDDIFNAIRLCSYADTKVVIVGQDPYINPGQAHGLSFSVLPGARIPPSLMNIFCELRDELGCYIPNNGCLIPWAKQGVLLLNSVLTVRRGCSNSHKDIGWEIFTDAIMRLLNQKDKSIVFLLWGARAKSKAYMIDPSSHLILTAPHPSPLAGGGFFGCNHFVKANQFLYEIYPETIDWQIPNIMEVVK